jgi:hypothetical protein
MLSNVKMGNNYRNAGENRTHQEKVGLVLYRITFFL